MRNIFSKAPADLSKQVTIRSSRDRRRMVQRLDHELARLAERVGQPYVTTVQVQPVIQLCNYQSYPSWRQDRETTWRREGGRFSTRTWPSALRIGYCAAVLLPLRAGRVCSTARDHPPLIASPRFTYGPFRGDSGAHDAALALLTSWVGDPGFAVTAQLAPPIMEKIFDRRIVERRIESFGLDWPLPPAQDLS
jgi:hypothetical protein